MQHMDLLISQLHMQTCWHSQRTSGRQQQVNDGHQHRESTEPPPTSGQQPKHKLGCNSLERGINKKITKHCMRSDSGRRCCDFSCFFESAATNHETTA